MFLHLNGVKDTIQQVAISSSVYHQKVTLSHDGFSLIEIIVAVFILGIAIVPMINAFSPMSQSIHSEEKIIFMSNQVRSTLNRIIALDFATLDSNMGDPVDLATLFGGSGEADKENFIFRGQNYTPQVAIIDYSGGLGGLVKITVTLGGVTLETLKTDY